MRPLALVFALLLTIAAAADELYVPLGLPTEVEILNTSPHRASVEIEVLGETSARVVLDAGERLQWNEQQRDLGVLRISGDAALQVTAVSRSAAARVSLPVLAAGDAVAEAALPARTDGPWRSGLLVVNPGYTSAVATVDESVRVLGPRELVRGSTLHARTPLLVFAYDVNDETGAQLFTKVTPHARSARRRAVRSVTVTPAPQAQTVVLTPSKDNTLYESNGETSNGAGVHVFAGTTQSRTRRRALLAFNVAAQVPPGSRITRVTLTLSVSQTISGSEPVTLHRVSTDWGEGTSNAGAVRDGGGASSTNGDATWVHTFFPNARWTNRGGDFDAAADATAPVASTTGTWESAAMTARVQQWLDQPASNFGWIVIGNESRSSTAKRFGSREVQGTSRPSLTIELER